MPSAAAAAKLDLYAAHKAEYVTPKQPVLIKTAPARYLTIEGTGKPGGEAFQAAIGALYNAAYAIKMTSKSEGRDYKVCALEGLWWDASGERDLSDAPGTWNWKLLIRTPDFIHEKDLDKAVKDLQAKGKAAEVSRVKLEKISEGRCVQELHVGLYAEEPKTIAAMKDFAAAKGLYFAGRHHEIYLSDPRRVKPEKLRTILRMPVA